MCMKSLGTRNQVYLRSAFGMPDFGAGGPDRGK